MKSLRTGISELDLVLGGGIPLGSLIAIAGGPGTGKTTLAQQICFSVATAEHKAIYYTTLAESHIKLVAYLRSFEFFDRDALEERVEFINLGDMLLGEDGPDRDPLGPLVREIVRACFEQEPAVVVIDSAKALRDFVDVRELRTVMYELASKVSHSNAVVFMLGEYAPEELESSPEFSLCDGIMQLAYEPREPLDRRWLRVRKLRGMNHLSGKHSLGIGRTGIEIFPRLEAIPVPPDTSTAVGARISSGIPELDRMMGGGIHAGDATAIVGPSGLGKTVATLQYIQKGLAEGEHCLYISFQESQAQLVEKAAVFGWELAPAIESGQLAFHQVPPDGLDLDTVGAAVRARLAEGTVRRVALDSLGELAFAARETDRFAAYVRSLAAFIRAAGASALVTSETSSLDAVVEPLGGLSFLFHNIILFRYIEIASEVRRSVSVLKMRESDHDKGLWQYEIDERGLTILDKLTGLTGVLGWSALRDDSTG